MSTLVGAALVSPAAMAAPVAREACGVFAQPEAPALTTVACAAVVATVEIVECSGLFGGNETHPVVGYWCALDVDWQFASARAHGLAPQSVRAEFRFDGTTFQSQSVLVPQPSLRTGPLRVHAEGLGAQPRPVHAEVCVTRENALGADVVCTQWVAATIAPDADPTPWPPEDATSAMDGAVGVYRDVGNVTLAAIPEHVLANALASAYDTSLLCRPSTATGSSTTWCDQISGRYGTGQLRFGCKSARPLHPTGATLWDAYVAVAASVDGTGASRALPGPLRGTSLCDGAFDVANRTATFTELPLAGARALLAAGFDAGEAALWSASALVRSPGASG